MQDTKTIRKEIYDFIKSKGVELSDADMTFISKKIKDHAAARVDNYHTMTKRYAVAQEKVALALKKAKTIEKTPRVSGQTEALQLVSNWLNSDDE